MKLIDLKDAAVHLGVEPDTLRKWCQQKRITHYRIGNHPKFKQADLERFIEIRRVPAVQRMKDFRPRAGRSSKHSAA